MHKSLLITTQQNDEIACHSTVQMSFWPVQIYGYYANKNRKRNNTKVVIRYDTTASIYGMR